jgi:carboxymethylenebutenolidase
MALKQSDIKYKTSGDEISGYLVHPDDSDKHPGIVLVHAIFGLDGHIRDVANRLASEGYVVLAPNLFSSKKLSPVLTQGNISEAMKFMMSIPPEKQRDSDYRAKELEKLGPAEKDAVTSVNEALFVHRPVGLFVEYMSFGIDYLKSLKYVSGKIGSVGFCFGGGMSINLACTGKTDASIIFYGENPDPVDKVRNVNGPVLGLYGGEDTRINSKLDELVKALAEHKKPFTIRVFPGARHAFFDDTSVQTYNEAAAKESWKMMLDFFRSSLY